MNNQELIEKLNQRDLQSTSSVTNQHKSLSLKEWEQLISTYTEEDAAYAAKLACDISDSIFRKQVYVRGIVEFSNYCKNDCLYCGIRHSNSCAVRYRLSKEQILSCCADGYEAGFRTFVLQSGEDPYYTDKRMVDIISLIHSKYPECAITLSIGEKSRKSYQQYFDAGACRYLLRHETADETHYGQLHPKAQTFSNRMRCLSDLKEIGYQTGAGFMVGSPYQTTTSLAKDMMFLSTFQPEMIGIGPFLSHKDTPFRDEPNGSLKLTVFLLSLCRIMLPHVLLPATTALGTLDVNGREQGILAGANVIMPNLSPKAVRDKYTLYDHKIYSNQETKQVLQELTERMNAIGYTIITSRGDYQGGQ